MASAALSYALGSAPAAQIDYPGLARVGTRLSRGLIDMLSSGACPVVVSEATRRTIRFRDWKAQLPAVVAVARFRALPLQGGVLAMLPAPLIAAMVARMYGGDGMIDAARTTIGIAEQRLFRRLSVGLGEALSAAWEEIVPIAPIGIGEVYCSGDVVLGQPDHQVVVHEFTVAAAGKSAVAAFVYPVAALRRIAALQMACDAEPIEADGAWQARLSDAVMQAQLPVRTIIARPTLSLERLLSLAPGDIIPVCLPARVPMTVAGRLMAHGTIGEANGRAALKIEKLEHGVHHHD